MANITLEMIKTLREKTQVGMMDCKKALTEANGDIEKAIEFLRKKGAAVAAKRSGYETNHGRIAGYISEDFKTGSLVEVQTETDFSANTDNLKEFTETIAEHVAKTNTTCISGDSPDCLINQTVDGKNITVKNMLDDLVSKITENIKITRISKYEITNGLVQKYIHPGSTLASLVLLETDKELNDEETKKVSSLGRDICMQIAVTNPIAISPEGIDPKDLAKEKEIAEEQMKRLGKPANIIEKIMVGKINKYYSEVCLLNQPFIKEDKTTVKKHIEKTEKELGIKISVIKFERFGIGKK